MKSFNRSSKKYNLTVLTEIEIYELVKSKKMSRFPKYFWECDDSGQYAPEITRYLIENILHWSNEDIKIKLRKSTFEDNNLRGMLYLKYDDSPFKAISSAYPERKYKPWDFVNAPNNYWQGEEGKKNAIQSVKWLIEEHLKWNKDDVIEKINHDIFIENNLLGMLKRVFHCSIFEAIEATYPGEYKRWEIGEHVKNDYWTIEEGILATKWLIEEKLKWSDDDIRDKFSKQIFIDNDLNGMIQRCFNSSPYEALNKTYPNKYKEWELPYTPQYFWTKENCLRATKWLIEEKLKLSEENIKKSLNGLVFKDNGLCSVIEKYNVYELLNNIYPGKYRKEDLSARIFRNE